jgi:hypothetical protein
MYYKLELLFMAQQRLHFWFWSVRRLDPKQVECFLSLFISSWYAIASQRPLRDQRRKRNHHTPICSCSVGVSTCRNAPYFMRRLLHRWASLGIKFASLSRTHIDHTAAVHDILAGKYIEAAVSLAYLPKLHPNSCCSLPSLMPFFFSLVLHFSYISRRTEALVRLHPQLF